MVNKMVLTFHSQQLYVQQLNRSFPSCFRFQDPLERNFRKVQQWRTCSNYGPIWSWEVHTHEHPGRIQVSGRAALVIQAKTRIFLQVQNLCFN